jgi:AcrR family transcriptional regulator
VESTRDRLVDMATRLLDRGGPAAVTLREVGRLAGVSHNAPYKHFADKEELLAAVAARELTRRPGDAGGGGDIRQLLHGYVAWALRFPARFKLTFGAWSKGSEELTVAATDARAALIAVVERAQAAGELPTGDPERVAALVQATAHGAVDLALAHHLSPTGKGHASPDDLVDDLLHHLRPSRGHSGS